MFADADMATPPDELAPLVRGARDGRCRLRLPDPARRLGHAGVAARLASPAGQGPSTCSPRPGWSARSRTRQCGFKGFRREVAQDLFARQKITSIVFDVEVIFLARKRGYRHAVVPIRWEDRRGSRMHPGLRLALRVAWDLFRIPLIHRDVRRLAARSGDQPAG